MNHPTPPPHAIVLAAGKGSRMGSDLPKPLVPLTGKPILGHLLESFHEAGIGGVVVVVGYQGEQVEAYLGKGIRTAWQNERLGTAHAVACALPHVPLQVEDLLVFVGDSPLVSPDSINRLCQHHRNTGAACTFLSATFGRALPYARVVMGPEGNLLKCVEERDASAEELPIREYLSSHFIFKAAELRGLIHEIQPHSQTGERYLTDAIDLLMAKGKKVEVCGIEDYRELIGLNTPEDLAWAESLMKEKHEPRR